MVNTKGFMRVIEAFIAVAIIAGVFGFIYVQKIQKPDQSDFVYQHINIALKEISNNPELREAVLECNSNDPQDPDCTKIKNTIANIIPPNYEFGFNVCSLSEICYISSSQKNKEVFSDEISISSVLDKYNPKKVRISVWEK